MPPGVSRFQRKRTAAGSGGRARPASGSRRAPPSSAPSRSRFSGDPEEPNEVDRADDDDDQRAEEEAPLPAYSAASSMLRETK